MRVKSIVSKIRYAYVMVNILLRSKKVTVPKPKQISARGPRKRRRNGKPKKFEAQKVSRRKKGSPEADEKRRKKRKKPMSKD